MKNLGNKNPENYRPQVEKRDVVNTKRQETHERINFLGINIKEQMLPRKRKAIEEKIRNTAKGNIKSTKELHDSGYYRQNYFNTKGGFTLDQLLTSDGEIIWDGIPNIIYNCLPDVIIGQYEDGSGKLAIYTKEPPR